MIKIKQDADVQQFVNVHSCDEGIWYYLIFIKHFLNNAIYTKQSNNQNELPKTKPRYKYSQCVYDIQNKIYTLYWRKYSLTCLYMLMNLSGIPYSIRRV